VNRHKLFVLGTQDILLSSLNNFYSQQNNL